MKIRDRVPLYCVKCGGSHLASQCYSNKQVSNAPLETPSHNGEYRGTAPVRVIPPGVFGSDLGSFGKMAVAAERGRHKQHLIAVERDTMPRLPCAHCQSTEDKWTLRQKTMFTGRGKGACRKFCSRLCQSRYYGLRRDKNAENARRRKVITTKTKWS